LSISASFVNQLRSSIIAHFKGSQLHVAFESHNVLGDSVDVVAKIYSSFDKIDGLYVFQLSIDDFTFLNLNGFKPLHEIYHESLVKVIVPVVV
jgi:hypothetical protein